MSGTRGIVYSETDSCPTCGSKEFHFDIHYSFFKICNLCRTKWSKSFKAEIATETTAKQQQ